MSKQCISVFNIISLFVMLVSKMIIYRKGGPLIGKSEKTSIVSILASFFFVFAKSSKFEMEKRCWLLFQFLSNLTFFSVIKQFIGYMKQKHLKKGHDDVYDIEIDMPSISDFSWEVTSSYKNERIKNYVENPSLNTIPFQNSRVVISHGQFNSGKTFVFSRIYNVNLQPSVAHRTKSMSIKWIPVEGGTENDAVSIIDCAGCNVPVKMPNDEKYANRIIADGKACEKFQYEMAFEMADSILCIINDLSSIAQESLQFLRIIKSDCTKRQKEKSAGSSDVRNILYVVHNWMQAETVEEIQRLWKEQVEDVYEGINHQQSGASYFIVKGNNKMSGMFHVILAREGSPAGNIYNRKTFGLLRNWLNTEIAREFDPLNELMTQMAGRLLNGKIVPQKIGRLQSYFTSDISSKVKWEAFKPQNANTSSPIGRFYLEHDSKQPQDIAPCITNGVNGMMLLEYAPRIDIIRVEFTQTHNRHSTRIDALVYVMEFPGTEADNLHVITTPTELEMLNKNKKSVGFIYILVKDHGHSFIIEASRKRAKDVIVAGRPIGRFKRKFELKDPLLPGSTRDNIGYKYVDSKYENGLLYAEAWKCDPQGLGTIPDGEGEEGKRITFLHGNVFRNSSHHASDDFFNTSMKNISMKESELMEGEAKEHSNLHDLDLVH